MGRWYAKVWEITSIYPRAGLGKKNFGATTKRYCMFAQNEIKTLEAYLLFFFWADFDDFWFTV
jgi:hypothetical protein